MKVGVSTAMHQTGSYDKLEVELMSAEAKLPVRASKDAVGYDVFAVLDKEKDSLTIDPGQTVKVGTGIKVKPPFGHFCALFARSGLATKKGLRLANSVGVIDPDYTGEVIVALHNDSTEPQTIQQYERIAQLAVLPFLSAEVAKVEKIGDTERGDGGFGSTGQK